MRSSVIVAALAAWFSVSSAALARDVGASHYVIIPLDQQGKSSGMLPHWTPSDLQARAAISFLSEYMAMKRGAGLQSLENYRFQILGVTADAGNNLPGLRAEAARLVLLQGFCNRAPPDLQKEIVKGEVIVMDGGNCYFRAYIDLDRQRMAWLSINGYA